jgi:calcineurin-like phosphoesterase
VIGVKREQALESLVTRMPVKFETSDDDPWLNAVLITTDGPMRAATIELVLQPATGVT